MVGFGKGSKRTGYRNQAGSSGRFRDTSLTITLTKSEKEAIIETLTKTGETIGEVGRALFAEWIRQHQGETKDAEQSQP